MEAGGAWTWGDPAQLDLWSLGADGRWLRGHSGNLPSSGIWRARVDLQRAVSFLRLSVFADWASSGGTDYYAVGTGLVFMDGITRLDVAHGLGPGREGRLSAALRVHTLGDGLVLVELLLERALRCIRAAMHPRGIARAEAHPRRSGSAPVGLPQTAPRR